MVRTIKSQHISALLNAALHVFIQFGYNRCKISDVSDFLKSSKGSIYTYVVSKYALFDATLRFADGQMPIDAKRLPYAEPSISETASYVKERLTAEMNQLAQLASPESELDLSSLLDGLYQRLHANRSVLKLIDRCAADLPEIGAIWFGTGRWGYHTFLCDFLQRRRHELQHPEHDTAITARFMIETLSFWAMHRHWDPSPQGIDESRLPKQIIELLAPRMRS